MTGIIGRWRQIAAEYRQIKSAADDANDVISAILFTLGALACGLGVAFILGGHHG